MSLSVVNFMEQFKLECHLSLRYSNCILLYTFIMIILYKYEYCYLLLSINVINFKAHVPKYITCDVGKYIRDRVFCSLRIIDIYKIHILPCKVFATTTTTIITNNNNNNNTNYLYVLHRKHKQNAWF